MICCLIWETCPIIRRLGFNPLNLLQTRSRMFHQEKNRWILLYISAVSCSFAWPRHALRRDLHLEHIHAGSQTWGGQFPHESVWKKKKKLSATEAAWLTLEQAGTGQMLHLALVLIDNIYTNPGTPSCNTLEKKRTVDEHRAKLCSFPLITPSVTLLGLENDARQTRSLCNVIKTLMRKNVCRWVQCLRVWRLKDEKLAASVAMWHNCSFSKLTELKKSKVD